MTCTATTERTTEPCQDQNTIYEHETIAGQDFVRLPGGRVTLGDPDVNLNNPVHTTDIAPFLVATTEVTNAQIDEYIADQGTATHALIGVDFNHQVYILARGTQSEIEAMDPKAAEEAANLQCSALVYTRAVEVVPNMSDREAFFRWFRVSAEFATADYPAVYISWYEAIGYADYMSKKTGREFRLLTEDEWEYAAKGGKNFKYATSNGNLNFEGIKLANYGTEVTARVGSYNGTTNPFGISDMTGNAAEWTSTNTYDDNDELIGHVIRGGSWCDASSPMYLRSDYSEARLGKYLNYGFRVAVSE